MFYLSIDKYICLWRCRRTKECTKLRSVGLLLSASPQAFCTCFERSQKIMQLARRFSAHTHLVWRAAHKSDCLIVLSAAKKRGRLQRGKVAGHWQTACQIQTTPSFCRIYNESNAQAIRTVNRHCGFRLVILSAAVSCKEENAGNQALQFRRRMDMPVNNRALLLDDDSVR